MLENEELRKRYVEKIWAWVSRDAVVKQALPSEAVERAVKLTANKVLKDYFNKRGDMG